MTTDLSTHLLTDEEFDRLSDFLDQAGPDAMNIETLDGFVAALLCGPEPVMPNEYLPEVWGEDYVFGSDEQAQDVLALMMKHWSVMAHTLRRSLHDDKQFYMPIILEDEHGIGRGNDWAEGFLRGVDMRRERWQRLFNDEERGGPIIVILMLAHENDPDPELRPPPIPDEKRHEILAHLAGSLLMIYRYFEHERRAIPGIGHGVAQRRTGPKIGRNEPCPCGSGKKYKQCCGA
jgi:uncharacterized protein